MLISSWVRCTVAAGLGRAVESGSDNCAYTVGGVLMKHVLPDSNRCLFWPNGFVKMHNNCTGCCLRIAVSFLYQLHTCR